MIPGETQPQASAELGNTFVYTFMGKLLGCSGVERAGVQGPKWGVYSPRSLLAFTHQRRFCEGTECKAPSPPPSPPPRRSRHLPDSCCRTIPITALWLSRAGWGGWGDLWSAQTIQVKTAETCGSEKGLCYCSAAPKKERWGLKKQKPWPSDGQWEGRPGAH